MAAQDRLHLSVNNHVIPESRLKNVEVEGPERQRVTLAVDSGFLHFGDNTIGVAVETTRQPFPVEIDRFTLSARPRQ